MFKDFFDEKSKKKMYRLVMLLGVCVIALVLISVIEEKEDVADNNALGEVAIQEDVEYEKKNLEKKLQAILSQINGAGELDVMITFDSTEEIQPAYNTNTTTEQTEEKDAEGGERVITTSSENKTIITSSTSEPIILKTNEAIIKGVIVVAEGADIPEVKATLYSAVQTALQIQGHQVEIYDK